MRRPSLNLYGRLFLGFCIANVITLLVGVFVTERFARLAYVSDPDWPALAQAASDIYVQGGTAALEEWNAARRREGIDATLYEGERNLRERPPPLPVRYHLDQLLADDSVVLRPRPELIVAGQRVQGSDGIVRHLVGMRAPRRPPRIEQLLVTQILTSLLIIAALGWFLARSISLPVSALQDAARRMAAGALSTRVGGTWTQRGDELGRLAADFDRMAARIEALVAHERGVLQDVSHELRSPLARLHLLLDLVRRTPPAEAAPHFERAEREIARLDRIIGEALALARLEGQLPGMDAEAVALDVLLAERSAESRIEADARRISLHAAELAPVVVRGAAALLERAVDNLLSNAIKFSPEGGRIEIGLRRDGAQAEISIRDHGPGVPEAELAALFRPFFRGSNAPRAEGHGLGLAIVQRIALAHGGSVQAVNAETGGLCVALRLPASPDADVAAT
ncbi:MAG: hypothetical protein NVS9B10_16620 [Nevskia sp.]